MSTIIGGGRALQICDVCGGVDDHPRHSFAGAVSGAHDDPEPATVRAVATNINTLGVDPDVADRLMAELLDTGTTSRHLDCCREAGCPTGECGRRTVGAEDLRGGDLLDHLVDGASR